VNDEDFEIEIKINSPVNEGAQQQGLFVEQDSVNVLEFEFYSDDKNTIIYAASIRNGLAQTEIQKVVAGAGISPLFMRLHRKNNQWTQFYSSDGESWTQSGSFEHSMTMKAVGVFVGNSKGFSHTGIFDYFINVDDPVIPDKVQKRAQQPEIMDLYPNFPNPFNGSTIIRFHISSHGLAVPNVNLSIYNSLGQSIRQLFDGQLQTGEYSEIWNGKNENGQRVSSGIYYATLRAGDFVQTKKMLYVR